MPGLDGVKAHGNIPTWIIQADSIETALTKESKDFPLEKVKSAIKIDCLMNLGGVNISRQVQTRSRQRACDPNPVEVKTGEVITVEVEAIYDQQAEAQAEVNKAYSALPEGMSVYLVTAYGWDTDKVPTTSTKVDVVRGTVQTRVKNQPVDGEDLMFQATVAGDLYLTDVVLK